MSSETIITGFCMFYELNYRLLLLTGLWPYQEGLELLFRVIVISICFIGGITLQSYEFYQREFSIEMIIQQFPVCILLLNTLITYCSMIFQFKLLKNISSHVAFDCNQLSNENEFNIMQKYAKTNKQITLGITLSVYLYCITLLFPLIFHILLYNTDDINDTQLVKLPFPIDPSLIDKKNKFFYLIVLLEICALIILSTVAIVTITSFFLCIGHACAILSIIICKIDQPWKTNTKDLTCDYITMCDAYNWIRDIVRCHVNVIKFVDLINALCENISMLIVMCGFFSVIANGIYIIHRSDWMGNIKDTILFIIFVIICLVTIINNSYLGQRLLDHGTKVLESLHQVSFYEFPIKYQKAIIMLLMRSVKPCAIVINGVYVLSLNFLARLLHTSLSYLMVYYNMRSITNI